MKSKKQWAELKAENSWTMFKVIAELVDGFETMHKFGPCVSIFGSARVKSEHPHYSKILIFVLISKFLFFFLE